MFDFRIITKIGSGKAIKGTIQMIWGKVGPIVELEVNVKL